MGKFKNLFNSIETKKKRKKRKNNKYGKVKKKFISNINLFINIVYFNW